MLIEQSDAVQRSTPMLVNAAPGALLWPAAMIVWGPGFVSAAHRHHSVQLVMALEGRLSIRGSSSRQWIECAAALVKADVLHAVDATAAQVLLAFVDPESELGAALIEHLKEDITPIEDDTVALWR